jgi:hypothetical protein
MALADPKGKCTVASAAAAYARFLESIGASTWYIAPPYRTNILSQFLLHLKDAGLKPSTAATYTFGVLRLYRAVGLGTDPRDERAIIGLVSARIERTTAPSTYSRHPMPRDIVEATVHDQSLDIAIRAGCLIAWNSAMRLGELLSQSTGKQQGPVQYGAITLLDRGYVGVVYRKSARWQSITHSDFDTTNNPGAIQSRGLFLELERARPKGSHSTPFVIRDKGKYRNLRSSDLLDAVRSRAKAAGLDLNLKGHSFRIGAATEAFIRNLPDERIRALGGWTSDTYRSYVRDQIRSFAVTSTNKRHEYHILLASSSE